MKCYGVKLLFQQKYDGSVVNVIRKAEKSAQKLMEILVQDFPSLRDEAEFDGKKGMRSYGPFTLSKREYEVSLNDDRFKDG